MNIIVCVKQVLDPETPPSAFKIDEQARRAIPGKDNPPVISPFDEQAVEAALRLKDAHGGKITVLSLGPAGAKDVVKHALAMGGDEGVLLDDPAFEGGDSFSTAYALSMAIKKIGGCDLILCGRQAADFDAGQVGSGIAEVLGLPSVTVAKKVELLNGKVRVERVATDGFEVLECPLPAVVTISNELGEPRYATLKGIMMASKKALTTWTAQDIGADPALVGRGGARSTMLKLFIPVREGKCEMIEGETPEEAAVNLALKLREAKLI